MSYENYDLAMKILRLIKEKTKNKSNYLFELKNIDYIKKKFKIKNSFFYEKRDTLLKIITALENSEK